MFKAIAYLTLTFFLFYSLAFLSKYLPYIVESYSPTEIHFNGQELVVPKNITRKLEHLNQLVEMPILGRFFLQEKILELVTLNQYNQTVHWAQKALSDPLTCRSFPIWYHKALAQCMLELFSECESSLTWASLYSSSSTEHYVQSIYRYMQSRKNVQKQIITIDDEAVIIIQSTKNNERNTELEEL